MARGRLLDLAVAGTLAVLLAAAVVVDLGPDGRLSLAGRDLGEGCPSHLLTGVDCPFCGLSHSFAALGSGRIGSAVTSHPLGPPIAVLFLVFIVAAVVASRRRRPPVVESRAFAIVCSGVLAASFAVWAVRLALG